MALGLMRQIRPFCGGLFQIALPICHAYLPVISMVSI